MPKLLSLNQSKGSRQSQRGFTIIELLMAMALFSFVLILASVAFVQINRMFHKSNTVAEVQQTARTIIDDVSRAVRVSASGSSIEYLADVTTGDEEPGVVCIGGIYYVFREDWESGTDADFEEIRDEPLNALSRAESASAANCAAQDKTPEPRSDMLENGFFLRDFRVEELSNAGTSSRAYQITVTVSAGGDEFLNTDTADGSERCSSAFSPGAQFCAVSTLTTTVYRRL